MNLKIDSLYKLKYYKKSELIASIPFIRNIIKYTKSNKDYDYLTLTMFCI